MGDGGSVRRHEGTVWGDGYALYLACGTAFKDIHIYQNSSNATFQICALHYM